MEEMTEKEALEIARKRVRRSGLEDGFGVPIVSGDSAMYLTYQHLAERKELSVPYGKRKY